MDYIGRYTGEEIDERLTLAGTAYQKPSSGIPMSDLNSALQNVINGKMDKAVSYSVKSGEYLTFSSSRMHVALLIEHEDEEIEPIFVTGDGYERFFISAINRWDLPISFVKSFVEEYSVLAIHNGFNDGDIPVTIRVLNLSNEDLPEIYINTEGGFDSEPEPADVRYLYAKPTEGIPASDMASGVQTSLGKADTALQPVSGATNGNLAGLNSQGKVVDLGKKPSDFAAANLVPAQASAENQLADKNFVNSTVQTETASFKGNWDTWNAVPDNIEGYELLGGEPDNNDYLVVRDAGGYAVPFPGGYEDYIPEGTVVSDGGDNYIALQTITIGESPLPSEDTEHTYWDTYSGANPDYEGTWRFKYVPSGGEYDKYNWHPEYQVNEKPLTAAQLAALNSGITDAKVAKLDALPATIPTEVFWATYGVTTAAEVAAALAAGKVVMCNYNNTNHLLTFVDFTNYTFTAVVSTQVVYILRLKIADDTWINDTSILQTTSNLVTSFQNTPDNTHYPAEKLVYDSLYKRGVISQTQTWTRAADRGYDYVMSDLVYGNIPQYFIDLWKSRGGETADFNEATGYFKYLDLEDISYEEASVIYAAAATNPSDGIYKNAKIRAVLPFLNIHGFTSPQNSSYMLKSSKIEVMTVKGFFDDGYTSISIYGPFQDCYRLHTVAGIIQFSGNVTSVPSSFAQNAASLKNIQIRALKVNISFSDSPRLSLASVQYMVNNAANTSAITITLHATAYARCQADTTEYTYSGQTYTGIIAYAAAKNITIQSA